MDIKGLKVLSRKSYEQHAVSEFDNPLAARYDENDALMYFDDVKVPWERVFVHRNPDMCRAQFHDTPGHIYQNYQAQIRLTVKLRFLVGLARYVAETIGTVNMPAVADTLGRMASQATSIDTMLHGMEAKGHYHGKYFVPDRHSLYSAQTLTQELYPQLINTIRELAGGAVIMLPSSAKDFADPQLAKIIKQTQVSADGQSDVERVKLLKLVWDVIGSEFGGRHTQYEMFYSGAQFVVRGHSSRTYDWDGSKGLVNTILDRYDLVRLDQQRPAFSGGVDMRVSNRQYRHHRQWRLAVAVGAGDAIAVADGRIEAVGTVGDDVLEACDVVIDAGGATATPGLIDSHVHITFGDYTPRQKTVGYLESYLHGGVTTAITACEVHVPGRPSDVDGVKALAVAAQRCFADYRPGGMRVHAGSIIIEPDLTPDDYRTWRKRASGSPRRGSARSTTRWTMHPMCRRPATPA